MLCVQVACAAPDTERSTLALYLLNHSLSALCCVLLRAADRDLMPFLMHGESERCALSLRLRMP